MGERAPQKTRAAKRATKQPPKARKLKLAPPSHQAAMQAAFELSRQLSLEVREEELIGTFASTMGPGIKVDPTATRNILEEPVAA